MLASLHDQISIDFLGLYKQICRSTLKNPLQNRGSYFPVFSLKSDSLKCHLQHGLLILAEFFGHLVMVSCIIIDFVEEIPSPDTPCMEYLPTLTPPAPPLAVLKAVRHGSPMCRVWEGEWTSTTCFFDSNPQGANLCLNRPSSMILPRCFSRQRVTAPVGDGVISTVGASFPPNQPAKNLEILIFTSH